MKKNVWRGFAYLFAALILMGSTAGAALEANRNVVDGFFGTKSYTVVTDKESGELYSTFTADYANTEELVAANEAMGERLEEEGAVLLKNNGVLPLADSTRSVTLLGLRADAKTLYGATIGVSVPSAQNVSLTQALEEKGFSVNKTVNAAYSTVDSGTYKKANKFSASFSGVLPDAEPQFNTAEPTVEELMEADGKFMESLEKYHDAAFVVLGRPGSEAGDYYPGATGVDLSTGARNPLALTDAERNLLSFAEENFDTVIVLINAANTMEIRELNEDEKIAAILWIGWPGNYGMRGVVDVLTGEVNPSGALPDLYASDTTSAPAMANFGVIAWNNAADYLDTAVDRGDFYLIEAEGIYTGYRYYETRYADVVMGQGNADSTVGTFDSAGNWNYDEEVVYPFGYGLSYTSFSKTLDDLQVDVEANTVTASVTVKNTGDKAGKTSVQLYAQAPYIPGGVEKSAIILLDFGKTALLQPGESAGYRIIANLQNLSSYDDEDAETYILDGGEYYFTVADGSHEAINNVLSAQGYEAAGNSSNVKSWEYQPDGGKDTKTYAISVGGVKVSNHLSDADFNTWVPDTVTYLSRSDWAGTWPETYDNLAMPEEMLSYLKNDFYTIAQGDDVSDIRFNVKSADGITFSDMKGAEYDDPRWEDLLNQLDLQEAIRFITIGNRNAPAMDSIGFSGGQYTENGPNGFNAKLAAYSDDASPWYVTEDDPNAEYQANNMGCAPLLAATFNKEFAEEYGILWGNTSLFNGLPFIWGPGLNLHRHAYNGRNGEYYSEDPVLSGYTGLGITQGALAKGLICAPKHYAFNDQESNRNGVAPFMNEQKARELELRSFQIAVEGGTLGVMTSFSRIGPVYVGAHTGLISDILCKEWGFNGYIISDMVNPASYMTWKESVIAGTTNFDTNDFNELWNTYITDTTNTFAGDAQMLSAIRNRVHNTLYVYTQSNAMNGINSTSRRVELNVWWRTAYKAVFYGSAVLTAVCACGYLATTILQDRKRKENKA
ncbi:MAG: glycoside hydrolase family 3 C-terminal domain-containing protein [Oscillospiraceae bacterium]|nr:glycoside hydrolase family 3 C-terminal domain-containing protein [Oscillospiraceae bacterium]MBP5168163.1 glycoside hydrolase family 3 C-terminal domain-containing protein [Oscillospiraceae bacterium]